MHHRAGTDAIDAVGDLYARRGPERKSDGGWRHRGLVGTKHGLQRGTGAWSTHTSYHADGNGNVAAILNAYDYYNSFLDGGRIGRGNNRLEH